MYNSTYDSTGWCNQTHSTNHSILMAYVGKMSQEQLRYVRKDSAQAAKLLPDSPKFDFYTDLTLYCDMALKNSN